MSGVVLSGLGHYAPQTCVTSREIEERLALAPGWIERRTGIKARRYVTSREALSDIAVAAGRLALERAQIPHEQVSLVLLATSTPDHLLPPSAPLVADRLGLPAAGGIDLAGACGGFIYALTLADSFVRAQGASVLVIAANVLSRRINPRDRASSVLFADAAGAAVVQPCQRTGTGTGIIGAKLAAKGSRYGLIQIPGGGSRKPFSTVTSPDETLMVINDGQAVFAEAIDMMTASARSALDQAGLKPADVTHFIPHQANRRLMDKVAQKLSIDPKGLLSTVEDYGNSSAATIPFTLSMHAATQPLHPGDILLMTAAGAGMTGGAVVWRV